VYDQTYDCVGVFDNKFQFFLNFHKSCVDDADLTKDLHGHHGSNKYRCPMCIISALSHIHIVHRKVTI
jgi:hypothetical protein